MARNPRPSAARSSYGTGTGASSSTSRDRSMSATPSSMSYTTGTGTRSRSRSRARSTTAGTGTTTTGGNGGNKASSYNRWIKNPKKYWAQQNKNRNNANAAAFVHPRDKKAMSVMSEVTDRIQPTRGDEEDDDDDDDDGTTVTGGGRRRNAGEGEDDDHWVTCITESKGSSGTRTVGIAAFQPSSATCILTQLNDSQTYIKTIHTLSVRWPQIIITPGNTGLSGSKFNTAAGIVDPRSSKYEETQLTSYLRATFGIHRGAMDKARGSGSGSTSQQAQKGSGKGAGARVSNMRAVREDSMAPSDASSTTSALGGAGEGGNGEDEGGVPIIGYGRRFFDSEAGLGFCTELIIQDSDTVVTLDSVKNKYYALSAASALFKFLEMQRQRTFQARSLKIRYCPLEGTMLIDSETAKNLELIENLLDKKTRHTLYGFLNHCYTPMATRLLRSNILSPSTDPKLIETRLDVVAEFMSSEDRFKNVRKALKALERIDADKITGSIQTAISINNAQKAVNRKNLDPAKESERKLALMLQLRAFIKAIPQIKNCLLEDGGCKSAMLNTIGKILDDDRLRLIDEEINNTLNEQVLSSMTKTALSARTSRVFAIKAERKRLLDVARETYKENINDVDDLLKDLQMKYPDVLDDVELAYSASAGFTFLIHETLLEDKGGELPRIFSKMNKRGKKIVFTCVDLLKRNQRIKQSLDEVFLLSSDVLDELLEAIRPHIATLYRCSEVIAMLDMLVSFAHVATTSSSYIRPEFTDTLAIKDGRHPVLERYKFTDGAFVPNDTYASDASSFQILTGPNMSGKTTFLKQIAMLVIMSQIGSYVPADYASFRLHDALLTRLSNDDSIEGNLSTFALEMKSMSMILSALTTTEKALVLVDELGRGTSPQEGVGIAHAIAEEIIRSKAFCFFATHFLDLSTTLSPYPNAVSMHLETDMGQLDQDGQYDNDFALTFSHRVRDGHTTATNYGLEIAKVAALPENMLVWARAAAGRLSHLEETRRQEAPGTKVANRRRLILTTAADLRQALNSSRMPEYELCDFLMRLQEIAIRGLTTEIDSEDNSTQTPTQKTQRGDASQQSAGQPSDLDSGHASPCMQQERSSSQLPDHSDFFEQSSTPRASDPVKTEIDEQILNQSGRERSATIDVSG